jgi:RNA polymerase sigma factor (sigma-70 family)
MTDSQLLAAVAGAQSSEAFAALVRRYADLVYGTARRMVGDPHLAEDVTQAAFLVLVKKAGTIHPATLPGWLVNTARLAAREAMRSRRNREKHESRAAQMRGEIQDSQDEPMANDLAPLLDEALSRLNEADRSVVVMRFLQGRTFAEIGTAMGTSEDAVRKRTGRAVEKLRAIFMKQEFIPSAGGLMLVLASFQAVHAPEALAGSVSTSVLTGGTGMSVPMAKGVVSAMTLAKLKLAAAIVLLVVFTGGIGVGIHSMHRAMAETPSTSPSPDQSKLNPASGATGDQVPAAPAATVDYSTPTATAKTFLLAADAGDLKTALDATTGANKEQQVMLKAMAETGVACRNLAQTAEAKWGKDLNHPIVRFADKARDIKAEEMKIQGDSAWSLLDKGTELHFTRIKGQWKVDLSKGVFATDPLALIKYFHVVTDATNTTAQGVRDGTYQSLEEVNESLNQKEKQLDSAGTTLPADPR